MPKPSRRERRILAEKGKLAPRRVIPNVGPAAGSLPRQNASEAILAAKAARAEGLADPHEYDHVKSDLTRIVVLATALIAVMIGLKFALPQ